MENNNNRPKSLFTYGNHKLPKTWAIWTLPAVKTCPGCKIAGCASICYARKSERQYPQVLPSRETKLTFSKSEGFENAMVEQICKDFHKGKIDTVRIHESGDFYSVLYIYKWVEIINRVNAVCRGGVRFLAYTKTHLTRNNELIFALADLASLDNMHLMLSTWEGQGLIPEALKHLPVADAGKDNTFNLPVCKGNCASCNLCFEGKGAFLAFH